MRIDYTAKIDNDVTGELGWQHSAVPGGSDIYQPLTGAGLAHDTLEHFAFDHVGDEIEAHGAMYRIRYEGGWSSPKYGHTLSIRSFADEWINLYHGLVTDGAFPNPPKTRALDSYIESDISEIIEQGRSVVTREFHDGNGPQGYENDLDRIAEVFRAYFRIGYRKAGKRYKGVAMCEVANLYNILAKRFEQCEPQYEEQAITVHINPKAGTVRIEEKYLDGDEY